METVEKLSITITAAQMRRVRESVAKGEFASTSEAIRDALRVWGAERDEQEQRLEAIKARIRRSIDDPRPDVPLDEVFDKLERLAASKDEAT